MKNPTSVALKLKYQQEVKKLLKRKIGTQKDLEKTTQLSRTSVSNFFCGKRVSVFTAKAIIEQIGLDEKLSDDY